MQRCLDRLTNSKWANSDILLVSDGELRQPGPEIMRKLSGAKDKLGWVQGRMCGRPVPGYWLGGSSIWDPLVCLSLASSLQNPTCIGVVPPPRCCCCCRLRVHGLIVGSPEKKRADPAVLRSLCSHTLPSGKNEVGGGSGGGGDG